MAMYQWLGDPTAWVPTTVHINPYSTEGQVLASVAHHYGVDDANSATLNQQYAIDLTPFNIPKTAIALFCRATLIITNDSTSEAEFRAFIGREGDPNANSWEVHAVSGPHDGIRQSWADIVPVSSGNLNFRWSLPNGANIQQSYGAVLQTHAYFVPTK